MYYLNSWLANPTHRIKIALVGVGGTGSFVLPELVAFSQTLLKLERKDFEITVFDDDKVEEHNVGRQKFFPCDIGYYKSEILANRVNRAYGTDVQYRARKFKPTDVTDFNIIITCVDTVDIRKKIHKELSLPRFKSKNLGYRDGYLWFDCGNSRDYGQIIMASYQGMKLKSVIDLNPNLKENPSEPSCSLRASLLEQSFMINKLTGVYLLEMIASLFIDFQIGYNETYFSLNPINVKTNTI